MAGSSHFTVSQSSPTLSRMTLLSTLGPLRHCRTHPLNDSYRWPSCVWFAVCDCFPSSICVHSPALQLTHQIPPTTFFTKLIAKSRSLSHGPWLSRKGLLVSHPQQNTIPCSTRVQKPQRATVECKISHDSVDNNEDRIERKGVGSVWVNCVKTSLTSH